MQHLHVFGVGIVFREGVVKLAVEPKPTEPQGLSMFQLFVLYVGASQLVNVVAIILPVLKRQMPIAEYEGFLDIGFLLLVVVVTCVALRWGARRDRAVGVGAALLSPRGRS
jgi:uncharacterized membrane protein